MSGAETEVPFQLPRQSSHTACDYLTPGSHFATSVCRLASTGAERSLVESPQKYNRLG